MAAERKRRWLKDVCRINSAPMYAVVGQYGYLVHESRERGETDANSVRTVKRLKGSCSREHSARSALTSQRIA
jgi:hypothetical protein